MERDGGTGGDGLVVGLVGVALLALATAAGVAIEAWRPLQVGWFAFLAMAGGAALATRIDSGRPGVLVWGSGLASGAMLVSVGVFLLPDALGHDPTFGGLGVAVGVITGFAGHTLGHRLAHIDLPVDATVAQLTAHSVAAGAIVGVVYGTTPAGSVGLLFGVTVLSHKAPAGYAAADRLTRRGESWLPVLVPAAAVGVVAVAMSTVSLPPVARVNGLVFGFATGVFLHVAMDFLPRCEIGSEVHEALNVEDDAHALLDRLRLHAVASTLLGGAAVLLGWWYAGGGAQ